MEGNQVINCNVSSCKYNEKNKRVCKLQAIQIDTIKHSSVKKADESMCASYDYGEE